MNLAVISVMYPGKPGAKFDMDYYLHRHMTMVAEAWTQAGLRSYQVLEGRPGADGSPPAYHVVVNMEFSSAEAFQAALEQSGAKIMGDVPNFTDLPPIQQVSETVGSYTAQGGATDNMTRLPGARLAMLALASLCAGVRPAAAWDAEMLHYTARLHGVSLLAATVCLRLDATRYAASLSARTLGLAEFLVHGRQRGPRGWRGGCGRVEAARLCRARPAVRREPRDRYRLSGRYAGSAGEHAAAGGLPAAHSRLCPAGLDGWAEHGGPAIAGRDAYRGLPEARVFDGRQLRRLTMRPAGTDTLTQSEHSVFAGRALRCETDSVMLAGFLKSDSVKSQSRARHGQLWLAPAVAGGPAVPVRITFDAELLGDVIVDLDAASAGTAACN